MDRGSPAAAAAARAFAGGSLRRELGGSAIGERLGDMLGQNLVGAGKRGDRPRDAGDLRAAASGKREALDRTCQQLVGCRCSPRPSLCKTHSCSDDTGAHWIRALPRPGLQLECAGSRNGHDQIEAVEQRTRQLVAIPSQSLCGTTALRRRGRRARHKGTDSWSRSAGTWPETGRFPPRARRRARRPRAAGATPRVQDAETPRARRAAARLGARGSPHPAAISVRRRRSRLSMRCDEARETARSRSADGPGRPAPRPSGCA